VALNVPIYDSCGPEGTLTAWHPRHGAVARPEHEKATASADQIRSTIAPASAREIATPTGAELSWHDDRGAGVLLVWLMALLAAAALAVTLLATKPLHRGTGAFILAGIVPLLLFGLRRCAQHGHNLIRVLPDAVIIRRPFPFPHSVRIARPPVTEIRISSRLSPPPPNSNRPHFAFAVVQLLSDPRVLASITVRPDTALWLAPALQRTLGLDLEGHADPSPF
jgi:hypothetical protein